jgi:hypothetical protein
MSNSDLIRISCITTLAVFCGCAGFAKSSLSYIGDTHDAREAKLPDGFSVSPSEAVEIATLHDGRRKAGYHYYHDARNYYACEPQGIYGSNRSRALEDGTIINGMTGHVYNREAGLWEPDPRTEVNSEADVVARREKARARLEALHTD